MPSATHSDSAVITLLYCLKNSKNNLFGKYLRRIRGFVIRRKYLDESAIEYIKKIDKLVKHLGLEFRDKSLLVKALTHRSKQSKNGFLNKSNERLEFLGDSVLDLIVGEYFFKKFPNQEEGFLTKTRSTLVDKPALAEAAERMNLTEYILYDEKYLHGSDKGMNTISADTVEALIGAIYLDRGIKYSRKFIMKWIINPNLKTGKYKHDKNYKGQLLEYAHSVHLPPPEYELVGESGPEHNKLFTVKVSVGPGIIGYGKGHNKKEAEQKAAKAAFFKIPKND